MTQLFSEVSKLAPKLSGDLKTNRKKQAVNELVASLFNTVRMSEWEFLADDNAYKFPLNNKLALFLTPASVEVRKGLRVFPIGNGKDAERLFNNIKHAQAVIAKAVAEQDKQVTAFIEAFQIEDLDAALADDSTVSADQTRVDIKIKPAPAVVDPAETSPESETAAALLVAEEGRADEGTEGVLTKLANAEAAVKALQAKVDDDPDKGDIFAEALKGSEAYNANQTKVYGDSRTLVASPAFLDAAYAQSPDATIISFKSLQGRVLTIVDCVSDKEQRTAMKTLINKEFRREMDKF